MLEPLEPQLVEEMPAQHAQVVRVLSATAEALGPVRSPEEGARLTGGAELDRRFNELVAYFFEHLMREEKTVLPATWKHFDDAQPAAIQGTIMPPMAGRPLASNASFGGPISPGSSHRSLPMALLSTSEAAPFPCVSTPRKMPPFTPTPSRKEGLT